MSTHSRNARAREMLKLVGISPDRLDALPAPALRRHAAARDDRHGADPAAAGRHHGRADHRARRGDAAADPGPARSSCASGSASRSSSSRTTCRCWSSSPTGSPSCTAAGSSRRRRRPRSTGTRCTRTARVCCARSRRCAAPRRELTGIPGSPPDLRGMPTGCSFHPRCPKAFDPCADNIPVLGPPGRHRTARPHRRLLAAPGPAAVG